MLMTEPQRLKAVCDIFHRLFADVHCVRISGGFDEPFYLAPTDGQLGQIQFRHDYLNSCLHEMSHWLIAGTQRRKLDDFGYWYAPDGRNAEQQTQFFRSEVKSQAMEWALAEACGAEFRLSVDNLNTDSDCSHELQVFAEAVQQQKNIWEESGFPLRATQLLQHLSALSQK